jgi:hypothetical protein
MSVIEILQVNLITKEDFVSPRPFIFIPNVVKFFTTKTFLNKKILTGNNIEIIPSLFLNREIFEKAIKLSKNNDYNNYNSEEIIKNNIEIFRKALFSQKEQIPIGSKKYYVINSKYVANSFQPSKPDVGVMAVKNVTQYTITFELSVLDTQRDLKESDFSRADCKLTARELNTQSKELFGISLGLDGEFPPMKSTAVNSNMYNPSMNYGNNMLGSMQNIKNDELLKTRREIREWLRDYEKKNEIERKELNINDWQLYKQSQLDKGKTILGMSEWINKRVQEELENKYKLEWLDFKNNQDFSKKSVIYDKWLKDKLEEELENQVEFYMKEWITYKNDQALLGKVPNLNMWLKERVKKKIGGRRVNSRSKHKRSKHKRSKHKRSKHKRSKHKRSKHKRSKHKRSKHKRSKHKRIHD